MLTLKYRRLLKLKCPRHPHMQYDAGQYPASCAACCAIGSTLVASLELDRHERNAVRAIGNTTPIRKAAS